jgi:hypothetical protein
MLEALSFASIGKIIAAVWANGSRFLWAIAVACVAADVVLRACIYFNVPKAQSVWEEYSLTLPLLAAVFAVFAAFKTWTEKRNTGLVLIADEQQSRWHHAKQQDGSTLTQLTLHFYATNMDDRYSIHLSKVRLNWPWVSRRRIQSAHLATQHPMHDVYSADYSIQRRKRRSCFANIMVLGTIGGVGRKKPMRVSIGVQDHSGRWHKLVFRDLRDPTQDRRA